MNYKQLSIVLGAVAIVLLLVVGYMTLGNNTEQDILSQQTVPTSNNSIRGNSNNQNLANGEPNTSSSLKTYTNSQYGFQFQYDPKIYALETDFGGYEANNNGKIATEVYDIKMKGNPDYSDGYHMLQVWVYPNPNKFSSNDFAKKNLPDDYNVSINKNETVDGYAAIGMGEMGYHIVVAKGNFVYDIYPPGTEDILSTFKFTK